MVKVRPDYRQFLAETFGWLALCCIALSFSPFLVGRCGIAVNMVDAALSILIIVFMLAKYIVLRSVCWIVDEETLCTKKGVFAKRTDYIELYRVVDYTERQTFLQNLFGVKTVTIISTDKTDAILDIYGVPNRLDLIRHIRKKVEISKRNKHIYEITNN